MLIHQFLLMLLMTNVITLAHVEKIFLVFAYLKNSKKNMFVCVDKIKFIIEIYKYMKKKSKIIIIKKICFNYLSLCFYENVKLTITECDYLCRYQGFTTGNCRPTWEPFNECKCGKILKLIFLLNARYLIG